jgi:hypothetical protein
MFVLTFGFFTFPIIVPYSSVYPIPCLQASSPSPCSLVLDKKNGALCRAPLGVRYVLCHPPKTAPVRSPPDIFAKDGRTGGVPGAHVHVESASAAPLRGSTTAGNSIYIRPVTPPVRPLLPPIEVGRALAGRSLVSSARPRTVPSCLSLSYLVSGPFYVIPKTVPGICALPGAFALPPKMTPVIFIFTLSLKYRTSTP